MFRTIKGSKKFNKIKYFLSVKTLLKIVNLIQIKTFAKWDKFIVSLKGQAMYLSSRLLEKNLIQFFKLYCNFGQVIAYLSCV